MRVQPRSKFVRSLFIGAICGVACLSVSAPIASKAATDPLCLGVTANVVGTSGPDVLVGTPDKDVVVGGDGDDVIIGLAGRDRLCGGKGNDSIDGRGDRDAINGGPGSDTISAGSERDFLLGEGGNDTLDGERGDDHMAGGAGSDIIAGGPGRDEMTFFASRGGVRASLVHHRAEGEGHDTLLSIEDLDGTGFADVLVGDGRRNHIDGGNDDDIIRSRGGRDRMIGGRGDDILRGGTGADVILDTIEVSQGVFPDTGVDLLSGGRGDDRLNATDEVSGNDTIRGGPGLDACRADPGDHRSGCP